MYEPYPVPVPYPVYQPDPGYVMPPAEGYVAEPPLEGVVSVPAPEQAPSEVQIEPLPAPGEAAGQAPVAPPAEAPQAAPQGEATPAAPPTDAPPAAPEQQPQDQATGPAPEPPSPEFQKFMQDGVQAFNAADYEKAARQFLDAANQIQNSVDAWLAYAVARFATGDYEMSAMAIRRGVRLAPDVVGADFDLRERYGNPNDFPRQLKALEEHVQKNPSEPDGWVVLGFIRHFSDHRDLARRAFEVVQNRFEDDAELAKIFLEAKPLQDPAAPSPSGQGSGASPSGSSRSAIEESLAAERNLRDAGLTQDTGSSGQGVVDE